MKIPKVLVIGDIIIDHYIYGYCDRISPEAPVPVVSKINEDYRFGGCSNVANNLISLSAKTGLISVIGSDENGKKLRNDLNSLGLEDLFLVEDDERPTTIKTRILSGIHQILRLDEEFTKPVRSNVIIQLINNIEKIICKYECVIISDYAKGAVTHELLEYLIPKCNKESIVCIVDPKGTDFLKYCSADILTPNKKELQAIYDWKIDDEQSLKEALISLRVKYEIKNPIVTLSEHGVAFLDENDNLTKIAAEAKEVTDVTGAGDTFVAALAIEFIRSSKIYESIQYANRAASIVVSKVGTSTVTVKEISGLAEKSIYNFDSDKEEIINILSGYKQKNKRIVFTNGCFDILHRGHLKLLNASAELGNLLIVGLNSDESVKKLKGEERPINNQDDRALSLSSLKVVDLVIIFSQVTPLELIRLIKPDTLVKGGDYNTKEIIGSEYVDDVKLIPFESGVSTTDLIRKIRNEK